MSTATAPRLDLMPALDMQNAVFEAIGELLRLRRDTTDPSVWQRTDRVAGYLRDLSAAIEAWRTEMVRQGAVGRLRANPAA